MHGILDKAQDAAAMFWSALSDEEKRLVLFYGCYVGFSAWSLLHSKARKAERTRLRDEILTELQVAHG